MKLDSIFKAFDALTNLRDVAREIKQDAMPPETTSGMGGQIENRLTNVLVAALKEAFDRDHARLELERAHVEEQRRRADEALRLEQRRRALDREIGRLRLLAGAAIVGWIASMLLFVPRLAEASVSAKIAFGGGCLLLLASLAASFNAQGRLNSPSAEMEPAPETTALWLLIAGLGAGVATLLL